MNKFIISSLPIKDVITDIAYELKTEVKHECEIYIVEIPSNLGSGAIIGVDFPYGLSLIQYDCYFCDETIIEFSVDKVHPVKFLFCLLGEFSHQFINENEWHEILQYRYAIVASSSHHGHIIQFPKKTRITLSSLEMNRKQFQAKVPCGGNNIIKRLQDLFNDNQARNAFYHVGDYSLKLSEHFKKWDLHKDNPYIRYPHLESLAHEVLVYQIIQYHDDIRSDANKTLLRQNEVRQIQTIVDRISNELDNLPTIEHMAYDAGINSKKLQQGFQELYGKSVNRYITDLRMKMSKSLLANTNHTLATIASIVGYNSASYFTRIFKTTYDILPTEYRKHQIDRNRVKPK